MDVLIENKGDIPEKLSLHLVPLLEKHKIIAFYGEMGAGKTTLIKHLLKLLNVKDEGSSPTFSIVNEYKNTAGEKIFHFDCYRMNSEEEAYDIGIEEYWDSGKYIFIEWPEKIEGILPDNILRIELRRESEKLQITYKK